MNYKSNLLCLFSFLFSLTANALTTDDQRYSIIQSLLDQYTRPITVLDLGANQGYYSLRIAHDYNAVCVMVEANTHLLDICKTHNELTNLILLNTTFTPAELQRLSDCEDFDVVLALNLLDTPDHIEDFPGGGVTNHALFEFRLAQGKKDP